MLASRTALLGALLFVAACGPSTPPTAPTAPAEPPRASPAPAPAPVANANKNATLNDVARPDGQPTHPPADAKPVPAAPAAAPAPAQPAPAPVKPAPAPAPKPADPGVAIPLVPPAPAPVAIPAGVPVSTSSHNAVGPERCKTCHRIQYESWSASKHKAKGLDCEGCHGNGADYKPMEVMKNRSMAVAAGLVLPTADFCKKCHAGADASLLPKAHAHKAK